MLRKLNVGCLRIIEGWVVLIMYYVHTFVRCLYSSMKP